MTLDPVRSGDPLSAARQNLLVDQVNALLRPGAANQAQYGTSGVTFQGPPETRLALFQLSGPPTYPDTSDAPTDHFDREPTPYATALPIWLHQHQTSDQDAEGDPVPTYFSIDGPRTETVWFPMNRRDSNGYGMVPPIAQTGDRVLCLFNRQSGRWEVVQGPPFYLACWGKLSEQLDAESSAQVSLWWGGGDSGIKVTAYDWLLASGTNLPVNTKVKVEFFPQDNIWWVTAHEHR